MSNISKGTDAPIMFKAGTVIFAQGKPSKYLYLVRRGEVRLVKFKGNSLTGIQLCGEREILNEVAILTSKPNELTAIAKTDVELVLVDQKDVLSVIKNSPSWIPEIFETLCERLKHVQDMIEEHNLSSDKDPRLLINKDEEKNYIQALADFNGSQT
ncbi:MAG: cyclic nucleotide-binding domain-containing protein [Bacteriovorax sp.]|nr:cyclic nucleotide-binding domain-containing protein [Bacteriovorax sp.]